MAWRWTAQRLAISTYLILHILATVIWVLPPCPIRQRAWGPASYYMMPLGLWQYWTMFAPDPVRDTVTLEAELTDAKGLRYTFAFPRMADYTLWQGMPRFRYSKYTANITVDEANFDLARKFAARHAVRRLKLPADAFPVDVHLLYQIRRTPPPGDPPADPMTPTLPHVVAQFHFESRSEVLP